MNTILFLLALLIFVWAWQDSLRARESAIKHCRKVCNEMHFQLLDETVALVSFKLRRDYTGRVKPLRQYRFEFSIDGYGRSKGHIVLHSDKKETIHLEHPDGIIILPQDEKTAIR
ncbi:MAG: DUF3301 domain-containing protein [Gammaproteobacteria bacterium]|jgi:hypothetical protein